MKRQRAEILSNVISHIKSAHPIEMWRSNKLGIKEKISRGNFPRLIFSCPVPSGLPHRSHCVPMNMNPWDFRAFLELVVWLEHMTRWLRSVSGRSIWRFSGILEPFRSVYCGRYVLSSPLFLSAHFPVWVTVWVKNAHWILPLPSRKEESGGFPCNMQSQNLWLLERSTI